jgi:hypothetical protein
MYSTRQRRRAVEWWQNNGRSVTATARRFGISRSTFYRWQERYDPERPARSLRSRWHRPSQPRPRPQGERFLMATLALHVEHPRWGRGRLHHALLQELGDAPSPATIGRWLALILLKCPVCKGRDGVHEMAFHLSSEDLRHFLPQPHLPRRNPRSTEKADAVREAARILRRAVRHKPRST